MEYCLDNGTLSVRVSSLGGELQSVKKDGKEIKRFVGVQDKENLIKDLIS